MKKYLWVIGLAIVIAGAFGYAFAGNSSNSAVWAASTVAEMLGGIILVISFLSYHTLSGKRK